MMDDAQIDHIVGLIEQVYADHQQLPPFSQTYDGMTVEDSYEIQRRFVANRLSDGATLRGYKVGLTSKAMQDMAGTSEPDYGVLLDTMFIPEGVEIPAADWMDPLVEIEIAFVLKDRLSGGAVTAIDVLRATDFVVPAIELVDFRIDRQMGINYIDTVADLAAVGAVIPGGNPMRLEDIDIRTVTGELFKNGDRVEHGIASAVLGNPVNAVAWLANKLHEFGESFEPGQFILTGSFLRATPVQAGDAIVARFDQGFGDVRIDFTAEHSTHSKNHEPGVSNADRQKT